MSPLAWYQPVLMFRSVVCRLGPGTVQEPPRSVSLRLRISKRGIQATKYNICTFYMYLEVHTFYVSYVLFGVLAYMAKSVTSEHTWEKAGSNNQNLVMG